MKQPPHFNRLLLVSIGWMTVFGNPVASIRPRQRLRHIPAHVFPIFLSNHWFSALTRIPLMFLPFLNELLSGGSYAVFGLLSRSSCGLLRHVLVDVFGCFHFDHLLIRALCIKNQMPFQTGTPATLCHRLPMMPSCILMLYS